MTNPKPQAAYDALIERLEHFYRRPGEMTAFDAASMRRAANALLKTNSPDTGWIGLVAVAALQWDATLARSLADRALTTIGPTPFLLANLAVSFRQMNMLQAALDCSERAFFAAQLDFARVESYALDLVNTGQVARGASVLDEFIRRAGDAAPGIEGAQRYLDHLRAVEVGLDNAEVTEEQLGRELEIAFQVLFDQRCRSGTVNFAAIPQPEGNTVFVADIGIFGDLDDEIRLGAVLAPLLAATGKWDPDRLLIDFKAVSPDDVLVQKIQHGDVTA